MKFTLPYPVSANRYWRNFRGHMVKSPEAREYQGKVRLAVLKQLGALHRGRVNPYEGPIAVRVVVYRPRMVGDLDNAIKVMLDALKGVLYVDDKQVVDLHAQRRDDKSDPRLELEVEPAKDEPETLYPKHGSGPMPPLPGEGGR